MGAQQSQMSVEETVGHSVPGCMDYILDRPEAMAKLLRYKKEQMKRGEIDTKEEEAQVMSYEMELAANGRFLNCFEAMMKIPTAMLDKMPKMGSSEEEED